MAERVLVIAPHPDDEVLGVGGTMARLADEGAEVYVVVATEGKQPHYSAESVSQVRQEALAAHRTLGVTQTFFVALPAAMVDTVPHREVNAELGRVFRQVRPQTVFVPFVGDMHLDHQLIFMSVMVASRPVDQTAPRRVYAYETLSETNWNAPYLTPGFAPNVFIDIAEFLPQKLEAMKQYVSQLRPFPSERSLESIQALAVLRGSTVAAHAAEAFVLVREIK